MIVPDANLLLYAYHLRAAQHEASGDWLEGVLSGSERDFSRFPGLKWTNPIASP